ncbi:GNAT family N-acetyltransferase [Cellulomonas endometrii]|uniref:GNAT family N-acetyltransferase n=1 Tax=Cellulomonas endometrii TaxID=3036301 RepID=UPI0024AD5070|nr:GNAT family N-acetyltransferase [Cellulomonas endometrii]
MTGVVDPATSSSHREPALPAAWSDDPFLLEQRRWWRPEQVRVSGDALLLIQRAAGTARAPGGRAASGTPGRTMLAALGPAEPAAALLREHGDASHRYAWVSTEALGLLRPAEVQRLGLVPARTGWEWMVTTSAPPALAGEAWVTELDPVRDAEAIRACLAEANPTTDADPSVPGERWWGCADPSAADAADPGPGSSRGRVRLTGVIGASPRTGRTDTRRAAHLHGLGVRPGERGRGLGAALTAAAVRALLADGADWVSLGMWDDNDGARRIYERLGLRTLHRLTTLRRP